MVIGLMSFIWKDFNYVIKKGGQGSTKAQQKFEFVFNPIENIHIKKLISLMKAVFDNDTG